MAKAEVEVQAPQQDLSMLAKTDHELKEVVGHDLKEGEHQMVDPAKDWRPEGEHKAAISPEGYISAPAQLTMPMEGMTYKEIFGARQGLIVKQTYRGCCCSVRNEFSQHEFIDGIAQAEDAGPEILFTKVLLMCGSCGCLILSYMNYVLYKETTL